MSVERRRSSRATIRPGKRTIVRKKAPLDDSSRSFVDLLQENDASASEEGLSGCNHFLI